MASDEEAVFFAAGLALAVDFVASDEEAAFFAAGLAGAVDLAVSDDGAAFFARCVNLGRLGIDEGSTVYASSSVSISLSGSASDIL